MVALRELSRRQHDWVRPQNTSVELTSSTPTTIFLLPWGCQFKFDLECLGSSLAIYMKTQSRIVTLDNLGTIHTPPSTPEASWAR